MGEPSTPVTRLEDGQTMIPGYHCRRCQHKWTGQAGRKEPPAMCPRCKDVRWWAAPPVTAEQEAQR